MGIQNNSNKQRGPKESNHITIVKASPYLITERRVPEMIPVLGSQPAGL